MASPDTSGGDTFQIKFLRETRKRQYCLALSAGHTLIIRSWQKGAYAAHYVRTRYMLRICSTYRLWETQMTRYLSRRSKPVTVTQQPITTGENESPSNNLILRNRKQNWDHLVRIFDERRGLPSAMVCACINCREEGKIGPRRIPIVVDRRARPRSILRERPNAGSLELLHTKEDGPRRSKCSNCHFAPYGEVLAREFLFTIGFPD